MSTALHDLERAARDSLATAYGHALSDEEWAVAAAAFLDLAKLLTDWSRAGADDRAA